MRNGFRCLDLLWVLLIPLSTGLMSCNLVSSCKVTGNPADKCYGQHEYLLDYDLCFWINGAKIVFEEAMLKCRDEGLDLVKIEDAEFDKFLTGKMNEFSSAHIPYWIGLRDPENNNIFRWTVDESLRQDDDYQNLDPKFSFKNKKSGNSCVTKRSVYDGYWTISQCKYKKASICVGRPIYLPEKPDVGFENSDGAKTITVKPKAPVLVRCTATLSTAGVLRFAIYKDEVEEYIEMTDARVTYQEGGYMNRHGRCIRNATARLVLSANDKIFHKHIACVSYLVPNVTQCSQEDEYCSMTGQVIVQAKKKPKPSAISFWIFLVVLLILFLLLLTLLLALRKIFKRGGGYNVYAAQEAEAEGQAEAPPPEQPIADDASKISHHSGAHLSAAADDAKTRSSVASRKSKVSNKSTGSKKSSS